MTTRNHAALGVGEGDNSMAKKGQFKKGGGRHGYAVATRAGRSTTVVVAAPTATKRRSPKRKSHGGGKRKHRARHAPRGMSPLALGIGALALAYATGPKGPEFVRTNIAKVPGAATFGPLAVLGAASLAYDRFYKRNKYAKAIGIIGIIGAALKVGDQGSDFKWVGDGDDVADIGDDDVGDYDDVGDDDIADVGDDDEG